MSEAPRPPVAPESRHAVAASMPWLATIRDQVARAVATGRLPHALLVTGPLASDRERQGIRADIRTAQISQILFNQQVKKQDRKKLTDFLPFYRKKATVDENVDSKLLTAFGMIKGKK